jgi:dTDP-4-dehydrorhamnose reductase
VLRLAAERPELRIVADQVGAPTWSRMLAIVTAQLLARAGVMPGGTHAALTERAGVYHASAAGSTSWHGFATAILEHVGERAGGTPPVLPIATADYPTPARRPQNSVLSNEKLARTFGLVLPSWETQLDLAVAELAEVGGVPASAALVPR